MPHKISNVRILSIVPHNGLVAFASFVVDDSFYFTSVGVHEKLDGSGYRLTYPTKKVGRKEVYIFKPLYPELSHAIEQALFQAFKNCNYTNHDRYHNTANS